MKHYHVALALLTVLCARPVLAWHVAGTVYCDKNNNGQIDATDTKKSGVTVRATALDSHAGATFSSTTNSNGAYSAAVYDDPNRYTVAIVSGLPAGVQITIPTGGTGTAVLTNSITQVDNFNFLVANNCDAVPQCTNASQCGDSNACTTDTCQAGVCVHTNNTASCDDGNACTSGDVCSGGTCQPGAAPNCNDSNVCTTDSCNPASGCVHAANTLPCSDSSACTVGDVCGSGTCQAGPAPNCNDNNLCTTDACTPASGCTHAPNTLPCSDGSACTVGDVCGSGTCRAGAAPNCSDSNVCTTDSCNPASGCVHAPNALPCSDGTMCTAGDVCSGGTCAGTPITCNDGNVCNGSEVCDPQTGACTLGVPPFLLRRGGRINNEATIQVDLGANDVRASINLGHAVHLADGTTVTADALRLGAGTSVYNAAAYKLSLARGAEVRNTTSLPILPIAAPFCPITDPFPACNPSAPVTVGTSEVFGPLSPGVYGDLRVQRSGTIFLLPGDYVFCSIVTGTLANIEVWGPGQSTFKVVGAFQISDSSTFEPVRGATMPIIESTGRLVRIGEQGRLFSVLSAPHALVKMGRSAEVHGSICADKVNTDKNTLFACP